MMQMQQAFSSSCSCATHIFPLQLVAAACVIPYKYNPLKLITQQPPFPLFLASPTLSILSSSSSSSSSSWNTGGDDDDDDQNTGEESESESESESASESKDKKSSSDKSIEIQIQKIGKNSRRIVSKIAIDATLQTVWNILTDYERLPDFIPGLSVSQLLQKSPNFARLFQIGQQNLAFGLKLNAKGIVDCYEKDLESLPFGQRRDIEFKMVEGDFQLFEGKWSIEQSELGRIRDSDSLLSQQVSTTLSYVVDVEPKLWLPVRLVEGRLCEEITMNLSCIREEAQKATWCTLPAN